MVAMLKEINPTLAADQYKQILVETARKYNYNGHEASRVVDLEAAINDLKNNKNVFSKRI